MVFCHTCENSIIDHEYEFMVYGKPVTVDALLCRDHVIKDLYYNRNSKTKSSRVDASKQSSILVGHAYGYCRGKFYKGLDHSILHIEDDDHED